MMISNWKETFGGLYGLCKKYYSVAKVKICKITTEWCTDDTGVRWRDM